MSTTRATRRTTSASSRSTSSSASSAPAGTLNYANLEELDIHLGNGGNTFAVQSTHGSSSVIATTSIDTGNGFDAVYVDSVSGPTTITTDAGDDTISVGSTTGGALANLTLSTLNLINAPLTLDAGTGFNTLNTYDTGDTGANTGVLTATHLHRRRDAERDHVREHRRAQHQPEQRQRPLHRRVDAAREHALPLRRRRARP